MKLHHRNAQLDRIYWMAVDYCESNLESDKIQQRWVDKTFQSISRDLRTYDEIIKNNPQLAPK